MEQGEPEDESMMIHIGHKRRTLIFNQNLSKYHKPRATAFRPHELIGAQDKVPISTGARNMCLPFGGHDSMITVGNCDEEMEFEMMAGLGNRDLRFRVLVEVEAAHRSHKWARPTT